MLGLAWRRGTAIAALGLGLLPLSCLRAPLTDEAMSDGDGEAVGSTGEPTDDTDDTDDPDDTDDTDDTACHASYDPCLPVVDDIDCPEVVALGLAPVTVIGPDEYGLDADGDGIGCED